MASLHLRFLPLAAALLAAPPMTLVVAPAPAAAQATATEEARLNAFLDAEFEQELKFLPQRATQIGRKEGMDRLNDISEAGQLKLLQWRRGSVGRLKARFDRARLPPAAQASYDMWALELERAELRYRFRRYDPPLYSFLGGAQSSVPGFLVSAHLVGSVTDMRAYNARLRRVAAVMDTAVAQSKLSIRDGIRMPRFEYEKVIGDARRVISGQPFEATGPDSPLWADAKAKVASLTARGRATPAEAQALLDEARAALTTSLKPGYARLIAWAEADMANAPSGRVGAVSMPNGAAWYAAALKLNTTTDLTAEEVHQLGLSEVTRITAQMDALARGAGFADAAAYRAEQARLDPPRPYTDQIRTEILKYSNDTVARVRAKLPGWFGLLPAYRIVVMRQPSFSEAPGGAANAGAPSPDGARPGAVRLHMLGTTTRKAALPSLMCHEGVPGHVMQGDIAVRQKTGPKFRAGAFGYTAFSEGWGLYAEAVCKEMGVYEDTASDFFRLDAELFRAGRLVVDTGIHAKGWTEDEAIAYMRSIGRGEDQSRSEVRRYITNAGQATAYKIGMIRMVQLRAEAEQALGPKFDLKAFHDLVIGSGSMPLSVLDTRVRDWIAARKGA